jgi:hypothetical protein
MWGKKGCPRKRNLREIYTENTIMFCFFCQFLCCFCLHITEYEQMGGGAKFVWAQGRKIPKYGPAYILTGIDVHGSVYLSNIYVLFKVQLDVLVFLSLALHVSSAICTHHQVHNCSVQHRCVCLWKTHTPAHKYHARQQ